MTTPNLFRRDAARTARAELDAATARMREIERAHRCAFAGCGEFGSFGFGPPGYGGALRWACAEHRAAVAGMRGVTP